MIMVRLCVACCVYASVVVVVVRVFGLVFLWVAFLFSRLCKALFVRCFPSFLDRRLIMTLMRPLFLIIVCVLSVVACSFV